MVALTELGRLIRLSAGDGILRRYFVVNGFDGALTMLGILSGFLGADVSDVRLVIGACLGAAVALFMSGLGSAYISEAAERRRALLDIEQAMVKDLSDTAHGRAARWVPWVVGMVNGASPLLIALLILAPIELHRRGLSLPWSPLVSAMAVALGTLFLLGVFLGRLSQRHWLLSGLKALGVGGLTLLLIALMT